MPIVADLKPLSARSTVLSLLLGAPAAGLSTSELTSLGEHLGISAPTVRVALTRAVAAGDVRRDDARYVLGPRLLARRAHRDDHTAVVAWDGRWEMVVVVATGRPSGERASSRALLAGAHLAELREGVWLRPANLARPLPDDDSLQLFAARPTGCTDDARALAATLWDLPAWAAETRATVDLLATTTAPAERLAVAAHLVRHLDADPLLPSELLPPDWPGPAGRRAYVAYQRELVG